VEREIYGRVVGLAVSNLLAAVVHEFPKASGLTVLDAYLKISAMDRRLNDWCNDLSEGLRWNEENVEKAPASFYLLQ
jgi:hypothetical protein